MAAGVDLATNCSGAVECLSAAYQFVCRYYSTKTWKRLSRLEAEAISAAGMSVVAVWEDAASSANDFGAARGASDAHAAYGYARDVIGQTAGSTIYFAVDYDASTADVAGPITAYFNAVLQTFAAEAAVGGPPYDVGVYGSGAVCGAMLRVGASRAWLAQSAGWRGSKDFADWVIKQGPGSNVCGLDVDTDESSSASYGGFRVGAAALEIAQLRSRALLGHGVSLEAERMLEATLKRIGDDRSVRVRLSVGAAVAEIEISARKA